MNLITKLLKSVSSTKNAADLLTKIGEVPLDQLLDQGVVREIPIIGTAISLLKAGNDLGAYLFARKIAAFLSEIESLTAAERRNFLENLELSDSKERLGNTLLAKIDKIESTQQAKYLGRLFVLMAHGEINEKTFDFFSHIVPQLNSYLIEQLGRYYGNPPLRVIDSPAGYLLNTLGLIKVSIRATVDTKENKLHDFFEPHHFGIFFYTRVVQNAA